MIKTAILVDGAFYRKRAYTLFGDISPAERAKELSAYCHRHIKDEKEGACLYRVFYYDCPPMNKQVYHPLLKRAINLGQSEDYVWANDFFKESTCFLKESEEISTPILMSTPFWVTDNEKSFSSNSSIVFTPDNIFFITSGFMLK